MSFAKFIITIVLFSGGTVFLSGAATTNIRYEDSSHSNRMIRYRAIYKKKSESEANERTFLYNAQGEQAYFTQDRLVAVNNSLGQPIVKIHAYDYFNVGDERAGAHAVKQIADFIFLQEALLINNADVKPFVREGWDYYKYCICLFFQKIALERAEAAIQARTKHKEETQELLWAVKRATQANDFYHIYTDRFNIKLAGEIPDVTKQEYLSPYKQTETKQGKSGYQRLRATITRSFNNITKKDEKYVSPYGQRAQSTPGISRKESYKEPGKTQNSKKITPTPSDDVVFQGPIEPKPAYMNKIKRQTHIAR